MKNEIDISEPPTYSNVEKLSFKEVCRERVREIVLNWRAHGSKVHAGGG